MMEGLEPKILAKVQQVLADALNVDPTEVTSELAFGDLVQWDSMGHMDVMMSLEQEFGIQVDADTITELVSVPVICQYIQQQG